MCPQKDLLGFYLVKEWNRAATLLMLALTRTEWTLLELVCELFHYAWGETESCLKILNSRPFDEIFIAVVIASFLWTHLLHATSDLHAILPAIHCRFSLVGPPYLSLFGDVRYLSI